MIKFYWYCIVIACVAHLIQRSNRYILFDIFRESNALCNRCFSSNVSRAFKTRIVYLNVYRDQGIGWCLFDEKQKKNRKRNHNFIAITEISQRWCKNLYTNERFLRRYFPGRRNMFFFCLRV